MRTEVTVAAEDKLRVVVVCSDRAKWTHQRPSTLEIRIRCIEVYAYIRGEVPGGLQCGAGALFVSKEIAEVIALDIKTRKRNPGARTVAS